MGSLADIAYVKGMHAATFTLCEILDRNVLGVAVVGLFNPFAEKYPHYGDINLDLKILDFVKGVLCVRDVCLGLGKDREIDLALTDLIFLTIMNA